MGTIAKHLILILGGLTMLGGCQKDTAELLKQAEQARADGAYAQAAATAQMALDQAPQDKSLRWRYSSSSSRRTPEVAMERLPKSSCTLWASPRALFAPPIF